MSQQSNFRNRAVVERAGVHYRSTRHGVSPVTRESQPSPGLAAGAFSLLAVVGVRARSDAGAGAGQFHAHAARPRRRGDAFITLLGGAAKLWRSRAAFSSRGEVVDLASQGVKRPPKIPNHLRPRLRRGAPCIASLL